MFDQVLSQLAIVATFVQKVIDLLKPVYQSSKYQNLLDKAVAVGISVALCIFWSVNLFVPAGLVFNHFIGESVTGVIAALGASVLNEVIALLKLLKANASGK